MHDSSLTLAGTGIKFLSHLTQETLSHIKHAGKILYLVNDPLFKEWINQQHTDTESLDELYHQHQERKKNYQAICDYILEQLNKNTHLLVLIYGHPCVFSQAGLAAVRNARERGVKAKILPAISAEACLFADLLIDPGSVGCQSFEASDFLFNQRKFDANSHLILWQIDVIGRQDISNEVNREGLSELVSKLLSTYPAEHSVILYEAAQYPGMNPKIIQLELQHLAGANISPVMTMRVPPFIHISDTMS